MAFENLPALKNFFLHAIADHEPELDVEQCRKFAAETPPAQITLVITQLNELRSRGEVSLTDLGIETNRWFGEPSEAITWIDSLADQLLRTQNSIGGSEDARDPHEVKDSNGAVLREGDSVQVIKDLKVRGGNSDLKRGTLIKKIHLIGDPENIECRVDGSTLVLKTCFLRKSQ